MKTQFFAPYTIALISFFTFNPKAISAPIPGTSSSALVAPQLGLYRSPLGFEINAGQSGWLHSEPPKNNRFVATLYRSPKAKGGNSQEANVSASLSVRIDKLEKEMPLDKYVNRWSKEYPKYGFDVLGSKSFSQGKQKGFVIDLINRDSDKQLRQVVFMKNQNAVILTCRDQKSTFKEALKDCNTIIRTFKWVE